MADQQCTSIVRYVAPEKKSDPRNAIFYSDAAPKTFAILIACVYVTGFLITSLHNFQYGFSEMNPLRPRILAAGGWFSFFITVPIALVWTLRTHLGAMDKKINLTSIATVLAKYGGATIELTNMCSNVLDNNDYNESANDISLSKIILVSSTVIAGLIVIGFVVAYFIEKYKDKMPKILAPLLIVAFYAVIIVFGCNEVFITHKLTGVAIDLWLLLIGTLIYIEMRKSNWKFSSIRWQNILFFLSVFLALFANSYYSHIQSKWGGGSLIPVKIYMEESPTWKSNQLVDCMLIDESDAGFYIVDKNGKDATFIPRKEVYAIHYGRGNTDFIFKAQKDNKNRQP
jgi:hypothetical protein